MLWETEVIQGAPGEARVVACKPLVRGGMREVLRILGLDNSKANRQLVHRLAKAGRLKGWKPGAIATRRDGRASNAKWVFDLEGALRLKNEGLGT